VGRYVEILGHRTWLDDVGSGRPVLLLHGGLSHSDELLDSIGVPLRESFRLVAFDRRGHGRTADTDEAFAYDAMLDEVEAVIELTGRPIDIVGWSDGGILALMLALRSPHLVRRLVLIGANFHYDALVDIDPELARSFAEATAAGYVERSPDGRAHFMTVLDKTVQLWTSAPALTAADLAAVRAPTLVLIGDDELIELSHSVELYESLPEAQLAVVPGASHGVPMEKPVFVANLIEEFLDADLPPQTQMPVRRSNG
jgi:pimeloyl-ACP methyl ester carboxylesterase